MKLRKIYNEVKTLLEKNGSGNNLMIDEIRFVLYFNFLKNKIQTYFLDKRNEDAIRLMAPYLILNEQLDEVDSSDNSTTFSLPEDYFEFSNLLIRATNKSCKDQQILAHEVKSENIHQYLSDVNLKPSFLYRETFYLLSSEGITVFKDDFKISEVLLNYYRKIGDVDFKGYLKEDGTESTDIDTDISDNLVPIFVNAIVKSFTASQGDLNNYQLANNEIVSPI